MAFSFRAGLKKESKLFRSGLGFFPSLSGRQRNLVSSFTLIELVMIIVIVGILASIAIPRYIDLSSDAKSAAEEGIVGSIRSGIMMYYIENKTWPPSLDNADNGPASSSNLFFTTVVSQGIDNPEWSKAGNVYTGPYNTYTYTPTTGMFQVSE